MPPCRVRKWSPAHIFDLGHCRPKSEWAHFSEAGVSFQLGCGGRGGSFLTMAAQGYMGRIFLSPVNVSPEQGPQFWVNIGFNTAGNQIFPEWVEQMEGAQVSKDDYDAMMKDLKEYFDNGAPPMACMLSSMLVCACVCVVAHFESGMNAVLAQHTHRFSGGVVIERKDMSKPVANVPQEQAIDQYGKGLTSTGRGRSHMWPPLGYNLILQVPREMGAEVRGGWPPGAAPARNRQRAAAAVPAQLSIPVQRELTIPSAVVQGVPVSPTPYTLHPTRDTLRPEF